MSSSFFRVSTANMYDGAIRNLGARQSQLVGLQENLSSGKRVVRASDDPVAAAQAERALTRMERIKTEQRQLESQRNAMALAESTLGDAVEMVQQMRELMVAAGRGGQTSNDRNTYATQLQSLRDQMQEIINRKDTNGQPLLGALGSALQPFAGALQFDGLPGQAGSSGTAIAGSVDGHAALMFDPVRDGVYDAKVTHAPGSTLSSTPAQTFNRSLMDGASYQLDINSVTVDPTDGSTTVDYTLTKTDKDGSIFADIFTSAPTPPGQAIAIDIMEGADKVMSFGLKGTPVQFDQVTLTPSPGLMQSIDAAIQGLKQAGNDASGSQVVTQALAHMDAGLERLFTVRGYAGELLNRADRITGDQDTRAVQLEADRSRAEDLDMVKGISEFQNANIGYEAALKSYAQVQRLSLFNYING
ncbi:flagellar hook-associated protein FlgL [Alicycliphilus denitrificans]|uniref:flagellar hook-associated protein FlgL n=1 Tax=Alicycliphilus denitrificans TaxID=179636 RepID=UPI00384C6400